MCKDLIKKNIILAFNDIDIFFEDNNEDVNITNYIDDSIQFITMIVKLEETFNIEIPEELLLFENFESLNDIVLIIEDLIKLDKTKEI